MTLNLQFRSLLFMNAYYNENDPLAAEWLRNLIDHGHIAKGIVDERSIEDVQPDELTEFTQCHLFAGIGVWSYALRQAGWDDDQSIWTGSCPCQPFSAAGKRAGVADERHLWPAFHHLIEVRRPNLVLGEQVASKDGLAWLDTVYADLEAAGYAVGAVDLCAAGVGAPHIRQRLWFVGKRVADTDSKDQGGRRIQRSGQSTGTGLGPTLERPAGLCPARGVGDSKHSRLEGHTGNDGTAGRQGPQRPVAAAGVSGRLADSNGGDTSPEGLQRGGEQRQQPQDGSTMRLDHAASTRHVTAGLGPEGETRDETRLRVLSAGCDESDRPGPTNGLWRDADWLFCRDERWRPVEPGTFPLVNGAAGRVGRLRAYGNALVAPVAQEFVETVMAFEAAIGGLKSAKL